MTAPRKRVRSRSRVVHEVEERSWINPHTGQEEGWTACGNYWKVEKGWQVIGFPTTCERCIAVTTAEGTTMNLTPTDHAAIDQLAQAYPGNWRISYDDFFDDEPWEAAGGGDVYEGATLPDAVRKVLR